jgi:hypothetical protein
MASPPRTALARRRRASARTALYGAFALLILITLGLVAWLRPSLALDGTTDWVREDYAAHREVELLRDYIAIDTSQPDGDQLAGALWFADQLRALGLEPVVERVGEMANVWAVVEGEHREAVVLHHHIDVDPVPRPDDWRFQPFAGVIDGPWLYGRGAFDMKSVAIAQLEAVRSLLAGGERPRRSVVILGTADEEAGSELGMRWFLREHPELVERFAVVLTEGGAVEAIGPGEAKHWGTEVAQARLVKVLVCGRSAADLRRLERDLVREVGLEGPPRLVPEVATFLADYAGSRGARHLREMLGDPAAVVADPVAFRGLPTYVRSFFVDRVLPQGVFPAPDGGHQLLLHVLLLPGSDPQQALAELLPPWLTHGFTVRVLGDGGADGGTSPGHWAFAAIDDLMRRRYGEIDHGPLYLPGTLTDARFVRRAGVPAFGFSPFNVMTVEVLQLRHHATVNERIALQGYLDGVELYEEVVRRLAH